MGNRLWTNRLRRIQLLISTTTTYAAIVNGTPWSLISTLRPGVDTGGMRAERTFIIAYPRTVFSATSLSSAQKQALRVKRLLRGPFPLTTHLLCWPMPNAHRVKLLRHARYYYLVVSADDNSETYHLRTKDWGEVCFAAHTLVGLHLSKEMLELVNPLSITRPGAVVNGPQAAAIAATLAATIGSLDTLTDQMVAERPLGDYSLWLARKLAIAGSELGDLLAAVNIVQTLPPPDPVFSAVSKRPPQNKATWRPRGKNKLPRGSAKKKG
jgi:hypothetical protein